MCCRQFYQALHEMNIYFFILIVCFSFTMPQKQSRLDLLCKKWLLVGIKEMNKPHVTIDSSSTLLFKRDGTFETVNRMYTAKGIWEFNKDSSVISSMISSARGVHLPKRDPRLPISDSIIKLSKDSLIYVSEGSTIWFYINWILKFRLLICG